MAYLVCATIASLRYRNANLGHFLRILWAANHNPPDVLTIAHAVSALHFLNDDETVLSAILSVSSRIGASPSAAGTGTTFAEGHS